MDPLEVLIAWVAGGGVVGLVAIGAAERFLPFLPSYGILVAIGIAAAEGAWPVPLAVIGTAAGSVVGCLLLYRLAAVLSEYRGRRMLIAVGFFAGMSTSRIDGALVFARTHERFIAFGAQLVPTVRLVFPVMAGLFRADAKAFALSTMAGIIVWNTLFIGIGHIAATALPTVSASTLAIKVLVCVIVAEVAFAVIWRARRHGKSKG